jgi:hypothetical protein
MIRHKSTGSKCDNIFKRTSLGISFIDIAVLFGSHFASTPLLFDSTSDAICK